MGLESRSICFYAVAFSALNNQFPFQLGNFGSVEIEGTVSFADHQ